MPSLTDHTTRPALAQPPARSGAAPRRHRVVMLLENNPYPQDVRVRHEARSLTGAGYAVTVVAPRAPGQARHEHLDGVRVIRFRTPVAQGAGASGYLAEYLIAGAALHAAAVRHLLAGATVLHLHNPPDVLFGAGALYRALGRHVVFDHHDLFPETVAVKVPSAGVRRLAAVCERLTFRVASRALCTNASYAEVAMRRGGLAPDQITIVRNGPPAQWLAHPAPVRPGPLAPVRLAYLGAISSQDGVDGIAPVLAALDDLDVQLTIIGDGDGRAALEAALARHRVGHRVSFTGWVPVTQVPELLAAADICLDPAPPTDVNHRSTMTKIAEYLALGRPTVAYDLIETRRTAGGAAELIAPGDFAAFAAAVRRLAGNESERRRLSRAARARAGELTWEHSERALLAAYDSLGAPTSAGRFRG